MDFVILEEGSYCAVNVNCIDQIGIGGFEKCTVDIYAKKKKLTYGRYGTKEEAAKAYEDLMYDLKNGTAHSHGKGLKANDDIDFLKINAFGRRICVPVTGIQCVEVVCEKNSDECMLVVNVKNLKDGAGKNIPVMKKFDSCDEANREFEELVSALVEGRAFYLPEFVCKVY